MYKLFELRKNTASRLAAMFLCIMMVFALSSCGEEPEPEPVIQVPYYIGVSLASSEAEPSEASEEYRKQIEKAFAAMETETEVFRVEFLYSEGDQLKQEHNVNQLIAEGMDCVFMELISAETGPAMRDLILDSGGTYGVFIGTQPEDGSLDEKYVFSYIGDAGAQQEISQAAQAIAELLLPQPEPEEGEETEAQS